MVCVKFVLEMSEKKIGSVVSKMVGLGSEKKNCFFVNGIFFVYFFDCLFLLVESLEKCRNYVISF